MDINVKQNAVLSQNTIKVLNNLGISDITTKVNIDFSSLRQTYIPYCDLEKAIYELKPLGLLRHPEGEIFIFDIPISKRLLHILERHDVYYLSKLSNLTRKEILQFRNLGASTFKELEHICNDYQIPLPL